MKKTDQIRLTYNYIQGKLSATEKKQFETELENNAELAVLTQKKKELLSEWKSNTGTELIERTIKSNKRKKTIRVFGLVASVLVFFLAVYQVNTKLDDNAKIISELRQNNTNESSHNLLNPTEKKLLEEKTNSLLAVKKKFHLAENDNDNLKNKLSVLSNFLKTIKIISTFEKIIARTPRSADFEIITPKNDIEVQNEITFTWDKKPQGNEFILKIYSDDSENVIREKNLISLKSNSFTPKKITKPGLYYWVITTKDARYAGRFWIFPKY